MTFMSTILYFPALLTSVRHCNQALAQITEIYLDAKSCNAREEEATSDDAYLQKKKEEKKRRMLVIRHWY